MPELKKTVIIVGAQYAGSVAAKSLAGKAGLSVLLVDRRDYFEVNVAHPRGLTQADDAFLEKSFRSHASRSLENVEFVQGEASAVTDDGVVVNGKTYPYDYLVIATGTSYPTWKDNTVTSLDDRLSGLKSVASSIRDANHVLVVGSGLVGVETAAEIKHWSPSKQVTLVGSSEQVLAGLANTDSADYVQGALKERGITVILGDRVSQDRVDGAGGASVTTDKGVEIKNVDYVLMAAGRQKVNTDWLRQGPLAGSLNDTGHVVIEPNLLVKGTSNVFAIGDCAIHPFRSAPRARSAMFAAQQGDAVAKSILALVKDPTATPKPFRGFEPLGGILGPKEGFALSADDGSKYWLFSKFVRFQKGRDMMLGKFLSGAGFK